VPSENVFKTETQGSKKRLGAEVFRGRLAGIIQLWRGQDTTTAMQRKSSKVQANFVYIGGRSHSGRVRRHFCLHTPNLTPKANACGKATGEFYAARPCACDLLAPPFSPPLKPFVNHILRKIRHALQIPHLS
jgi:hypothetical protein